MSNKSNQDVFDVYHNQSKSIIKRMSNEGRINIMRIDGEFVKPSKEDQKKHRTRQPLHDMTNMNMPNVRSRDKNAHLNTLKKQSSNALIQSSSSGPEKPYTVKYRRVLGGQKQMDIPKHKNSIDHEIHAPNTSASRLSLFEISSIIGQDKFSKENYYIANSYLQDIYREFDIIRLSSLHLINILKCAAFDYLLYLIWWTKISRIHYVRSVDTYDRLRAKIMKRISDSSYKSKSIIESSLVQLVDVSKERYISTKNISDHLQNQLYATLDSSKFQQATHIVTEMKTIGVYVESVSVFNIEKRMLEQILLAKTKRDLNIQKSDLINVLPEYCTHQNLNGKKIILCFKWTIIKSSFQ